MTTFVEVAFRYGVMSVVIDVKFTSIVVYVTFATGHQFSLTVSWITKQQFVTSSLVVRDGGNDFNGALIFGEVEFEVDFARIQVTTVAKRTTRLLKNIMESVGNDRVRN